ncbi:hypothetical protein QBC38DRAFT_491302 [Podospora fimiseda]|uniref:Uncharacterized protein n=1 Tax=Podospora fimiseda TaxID=252190 RepID=A0AAN6YMH6_9PEZI|nr:hypothetical protein QBC38DRAFT_491302 [Podospora fimiseda]
MPPWAGALFKGRRVSRASFFFFFSFSSSNSLILSAASRFDLFGLAFFALRLPFWLLFRLFQLNPSPAMRVCGLVRVPGAG